MRSFIEDKNVRTSEKLQLFFMTQLMYYNHFNISMEIVIGLVFAQESELIHLIERLNAAFRR